MATAALPPPDPGAAPVALVPGGFPGHVTPRACPAGGGARAPAAFPPGGAPGPGLLPLRSARANAASPPRPGPCKRWHSARVPPRGGGRFGFSFVYLFWGGGV